MNIHNFEVSILDPTILKNFDIYQVMTSGQHFRHRITFDGIVFVWQDGIFHISQKEREIRILGSKAFDFETFFDLTRDYGAIKERLTRKDVFLKEAINMHLGLRILRQDPFEMLLTFIISQSKQISQIKVLVERLSALHGTKIGKYEDVIYYGFPTPEQLAPLTEMDYREMKLGYRSPYIKDAVYKVNAKLVDLEKINHLSYEEGKKVLMTINGVGEKVADCVLLFGYGKFESFPIDTWVKKIIGKLYFKEEPSLKEIKEFVAGYFQEDRGIAQQYLFEYARRIKF